MSTQPLPGTVLAAATPAITFPRKPDGSVNWRALVRPECLYVKSEHKETVARLLNKPIEAIRDLGPEDIVKVPDRMLVIRKAGILELARLRGYTSAIPEVQHAQRDYVIVRTLVTWDPFEGQPAKVTGGVGEACPENTTAMGAAYLAATAQNRAFARAVRDFLEIDIVCSDELGKDGMEPESRASTVAGATAASATVAAATEAPGGVGPVPSLTKAALSAGFSFINVKDAALARWHEDTKMIATNPTTKRRIENDPKPWTNWSEVPPRDCLTLIQLIKAAEAARKTAANGSAPTAAAPASAAKPAVVRAPRKPKVTPAPAATITPIESAAAAPEAVAA